jgi:hypothetical protein
MTSPIILLLLLAGLSEAAGRVVPLIARRPDCSRTLTAGVLLVDASVEASAIALWPLVTGAFVAHPMPTSLSSSLPSSGLGWTPGLLAPLLLAGVLALPMLGPLLHFVLFVGVGVGLADALSAAGDVAWWSAAGCVATGGVTLACTVALLRRLGATILATAVPDAAA